MECHAGLKLAAAYLVNLLVSLINVCTAVKIIVFSSAVRFYSRCFGFGIFEDSKSSDKVVHSRSLTRTFVFDLQNSVLLLNTLLHSQAHNRTDLCLCWTRMYISARFGWNIYEVNKLLICFFWTAQKIIKRFKRIEL